MDVADVGVGAAHHLGGAVQLHGARTLRKVNFFFIYFNFFFRDLNCFLMYFNLVFSKVKSFMVHDPAKSQHLSQNL